jgi:hypothetical protein
MPRVVILGYDGLEITLVERLGLRELMQREHGRVRVPTAGGLEDPSTPIVWTSFITGQPPETHGIDMPQLWGRMDSVRSRVRRLGPLYRLMRRLKVGYAVRRAMGVKSRFPGREDIRCETLFDVVKPSVAVSVPVYNEDLWERYPIRGVVKAREDPAYREWYVRRVRELHEGEVGELLEALERDWRLLMAHFYITDALGHIYWGTERLATLYEEMALLTRKVREKLTPGDVILIISDHGMDRLGHTRYGFYSLNIRLGLREPSITEFFRIIKAIITMDKEND